MLLSSCSKDSLYPSDASDAPTSAAGHLTRKLSNSSNNTGGIPTQYGKKPAHEQDARRG